MRGIPLIVLVACGPRISPSTPRPLPALTTWQLRVCNDTALPMGRFTYDGDEENPGRTQPGECSGYVDTDPDSFVSQLRAWAGKQELGAGAQNLAELPFGFYSFRVKRHDNVVSIERSHDQPAVLTRICNRTGRSADVIFFSLDPIVAEKPLSPDACAPYRVAFAPADYHGGNVVIGRVDDAPITYAIAPLPPTSPALGPGAWTFDLEIADANAHVLRLHRHAAPD